MSPELAAGRREALRRARLRAGLTQRALADLLGVTVHAVRGWEKGGGGSPSTDHCLEAVRKLRDGQLLNDVLRHVGFRCEAVPSADGERERRIQKAARLLGQAQRLLGD